MKSTEDLDRPGRRRFLGTCAAGALTWHFGTGVAAAQTADASFALISETQADALRARVPEKVAASVVRKARESLGRASHVMPVVHTQGMLPHQGNRDDSVLAQGDWRDTVIQALAWRLSGDEAHLERAVAYVRDWLAVYHPSFDPIDETEVATWIFGFDLVRARLAPETVAAMREFGRALADGYSAVPHRVGDHSTGLNNWQSHRIKLATAGAFVSGDAARVAAARERFFAHVDSNIRDDGSTYDFVQRDALHYVVYTLEPMLSAATLAAAHGEDWYGAERTGRKLAKALAWLQPYALGEKQHEEFVNSSVPFDQRRAAAGVKGFSGLWQPQSSTTLYHIAAQLDAAFVPVSAALPPAPPPVRALYSRRFARPA
ncbi:alginate lyase family protein [Pandoraea sp. NPDC087047]|uniref:alginate lyase family protein n=1 Tax=Pandoraea sp. NPDC087047 TaxID=3364390 RepID=UPI00382992D3